MIMELPPGLEDEDDNDEVVVAFCGSVMEKYFNFRERCQEVLDELIKYPLLDRTTKIMNGVNRIVGTGELNGVVNPVTGVGRFVNEEMDVQEQRRVVLEENRDGGILGAGILAAVVDNKRVRTQ